MKTRKFRKKISRRKYKLKGGELNIKIIQNNNVEDCNNDEIYLENRADGNCLFDSFAQIYNPIHHIRNVRNEQFNKEVIPISDHLRKLVSDIYEKAINNLDFKNKHYLLHNLSDNDLIEERLNYIKKNGSWGEDKEVLLLVEFLEIPILLFNTQTVHTKNGNKIQQYYEKITIDNRKPEYTLCNTRLTHFRLKRHNNPRNIIDDLINAYKKIGISAPESILSLTVSERIIPQLLEENIPLTNPLRRIHWGPNVPSINNTRKRVRKITNKNAIIPINLGNENAYYNLTRKPIQATPVQLEPKEPNSFNKQMLAKNKAEKEIRNETAAWFNQLSQTIPEPIARNNSKNRITPKKNKYN